MTAHWKFILRAPAIQLRAIRHLRRKCNRTSHSRKRTRYYVDNTNNLPEHLRAYSIVSSRPWTQSNSLTRQQSRNSRNFRVPVAHARHLSSSSFTAHPTRSRQFKTIPVPLPKMDDRFSPRSAHSDDALAQTLHDPMFEPQPSFNFAESHNEEPRPLQPSMGSPNAPNQNQQTFFNPVNGTR